MPDDNSRIKAVLFDFDGTLTKPETLDFPAFKKSVGCPVDQPVLEYIQGLPDPDERDEAFEKLDLFETEGAANTEPNDGAEEVISYLKSKGIRLAILSRNSRLSIERAFDNFDSIRSTDFELILSRDEPVAPKPDPEGVMLVAQTLNVNAEQMMVVGDFHFDVQAGKAAGAVTVFLDNGSASSARYIDSDYRISNLNELKTVIRMETPLPAGKFPNDLLEAFLDEYPFEDPSVLIHPGVGEDTAAIDVMDEEVLILKSDPITFATDAIGEYAVLVNANDIATAGAKPRWFLTTLLFPCGIRASDIWKTMTDLQTICQKWGITLCGGHTEITDSVNRPVITGMLAGTVLKKNLVDKRNMKTGDRVLLTKSVAVEGTAIIAREFEVTLEKKGMSRSDIATCKAFLSQISILPEAGIAGSTDGVSAMHDITEGGISTAVGELSIAGRHQIHINMDQIPMFPQTKEISRLIDIDPMGLIGSGSLLICCRKCTVAHLMKQIRKAGIQVTCIGEVLEPGQGISATQDGKPVKWPSFEVDEITRLF